MTKKELKLKIKEEQKTLAQNIKRCRSLRKPHLFQEASEKMQQQCLSWKVQSWSWDYRHKHIAYCQMFNNTPYERIERTTREDNRPNKSQIKKYQKEWEGLLDEALRDCA